MYSICFAITIFVVNKDCARVIEMNMTDCRKIWLLPAALTGLLPTCLVVRVVRSSHRVCVHVFVLNFSNEITSDLHLHCVPKK